jgi:NADP-dependent aldehyde dehydrogenase
MFGNQIAGQISAEGKSFFSSFNPVLNSKNEEVFSVATSEEIENALDFLEKSFYSFANSSSQKRFLLLKKIAEEFLKSKNKIQDAYCKESGLSHERFEIEFNRTYNQVILFAHFLEKSNGDVISENEADSLKNLPKLTKKRIPLGPIVVFGASNFPLAYSTLGGDTVAALAAGCPVIVKAHPFHPETSYLVGEVIQNAIAKTEISPGIFSQLFDDGYYTALKLVQDRRIKAGGFTGSYQGGKALYDLAQSRDNPIPFFAEMGSSNPVFVFPELMDEKKEEWTSIFAKSITNDAGQFCTKPGIFFVPNTSSGEDFIEKLCNNVLAEPSFYMLHPTICSSYEKNKIARLNESKGVLFEKPDELESNQGRQGVLVTNVEDLFENPTLQDEVFGPFAIIFKYNSNDELKRAIELLNGQLTSSILCSDTELEEYDEIIFTITQKAGRIIRNGVPTGVRVCESMHHGGPFPATTDSRFTAVGTDSILRFTRPVVYQG